jgi:endoglucanase
MKLNTELFKNMCQTIGVSSGEEKIRELIKEDIKDFVDEIRVDTLGNLIAHKKGSGKKIMLAGHMDQIGFMVSEITKDGFIKISALGGLRTSTLISQRVVFENGTVGVVVAGSDFEKSGDITKLKADDLFIDIGSTSREEAEKKVSVGDLGTFDSEFYEDDENIIAKAIDDRVGCFVLAEVAKANVITDKDIYYVFTSQEEVGTRGAKTSAFNIKPELAVAVDITPSGDAPGTKNSNVKIGGGAAVKLMDKSMVTSREMKKLMTEVAEEKGIKYQYEILKRGGTDAGAVNLSREGVLSGTISVPTRNSHTANELIRKSDLKDSIELLIGILEKNI